MPKSPQRKLVQRMMGSSLPQGPIGEAIRAFLQSMQAASNSVRCTKCGSASDLQRMTASLWGSDETWEISLPLCMTCGSRETAGVDYEYEQLVENRQYIH